MIQRIAALSCLLLLCSCVRQGDLARRIRLSYRDPDVTEVVSADEVVPADFRGKSGTAARIAAVSYYEQRWGAFYPLGQGPKAMALLRETMGAPGMQSKEAMAACAMAAVGTELMRPAFDRWVRLDPDNALPHYVLAYHHALAGTPERIAEAVVAGNSKPECQYYPALHVLAEAGLVSPQDIQDIRLSYPVPHSWFRAVAHHFRDQRFGSSDESRRQCAAALMTFGDRVSEMKPRSGFLFLTGSAITSCAVHSDDPGEWLTPALKRCLRIREQLGKEFVARFLAAEEAPGMSYSEERRLVAEMCRKRHVLMAEAR